MQLMSSADDDRNNIIIVVVVDTIHKLKAECLNQKESDAGSEMISLLSESTRKIGKYLTR
jgi:hypothetical protein